MENTKLCGRCRLSKPYAEFSRLASSKDGFNVRCRACDKARKPPRDDYDPRYAQTGAKGHPPKLIIDGEQLCSKCDTWKPVAQFSKSARSKTGLAYRCKTCEKAYYEQAKIERGPEFMAKRRANGKSLREADPEFYRRQAAYRKTHIQIRLRDLLRTRLYNAVRQQLKRQNSVVARCGGSAVRDLGCTIPELMVHLERQWKPGMTWENYGGWHIDHVTPLVRFDLTDRVECLKACHFTNLQPLWATENLAKGAT